MTLREELEPFFKPKSLAIIGASDDPLKFGNWVTATVVKSKFKGNYYLVNPKGKEIMGVKTYTSLKDIPGSVDLAGIIVPSDSVPKVLEECMEKGVKGVVIFTSGFKEIGEEGAKREDELLEIARKGHVRIVGPNCMGIYSSAVNLNITILSSNVPGGVAFISQSGGYGAEIFGTMMSKGVSFSKFISTGDKADLKDWEYLEYLRTDPDTKSILMYIEGFEEGEGRKFFEVAHEVTKEKPIFAIKIGRTVAGGRAAKSHTGALAGEDAVFDAAFKQAGIIRAMNIEELYDYIKAYMSQPLPKGNRVGMLVGSGGLGSAAVDECVERGLLVPPLEEKNQQSLRSILPPFAAVTNPVDFTASGAPTLFTNMDILKDVFKDPNTDSWFFGFTGTAVAGLDEIIETFKPMIDSIDSKEIMGDVNKPCVGCIGENDRLIRPFIEKMFGPLFFPTPERAIRALGVLHRFRQILDERASVKKSLEFKGNESICRKVIDSARKSNRIELTEVESKQILSAYQIPVTATFLARNKEEAVRYAEQIGYPVVLKITSPDIIHKSDAGGVKLNLNNRKEVTEAFDEILGNTRKFNAKASILGISVQKMTPQGVEVMVGMKEDAQFGPVVMFAIGGIFVELFKDFSLRLIPLDAEEAKKMMGELKMHSLLEGYRQYKPVDKDSVVDIIIKVSALARQNLSIKEIDLNPIFLYPKGAITVDARIVLKNE
jgi:acyl-CoA synthetase (NDP forming)